MNNTEDVPFQKKEFGMKHLLIGGGIIIGFFILIGSFGSSGGGSANTPSPQPQRDYITALGAEGRVNNNKDASSCEGIVALALTKSAFDDLANATVANDEYGYTQVFTQGRAVILDNCTEVKILERDLAKTKVRVISDPEVAGWVPVEWVVQ